MLKNTIFKNRVFLLLLLFCKVIVGYKNENKGVIEDFFFNNDNSKNISRNFSGAVVGCVGSIQFQIVS